MPNRIKEDHKKFIDVVEGTTRRELKKFISSGAIIKQRPKGGRITISIPQINTPHFVHGDQNEGIGRGSGKRGDIVGRDPQPGNGSGAGDGEHSDGIKIQVDMEFILQFLEKELSLPRMVPKENETFEEIKIKYNDISKVGLNSLRHTRRTMKEALKRLSMTGELNKLRKVPGSDVPMKVVSPLKSDFRYRQYKEVKIPSSNAVIFFVRDYSGSMTNDKCEIVSNMSWWIDCWIRRFYEKVTHVYCIHDTKATEVTEEDFYKIRNGGGTRCSSGFEFVAEQLVDRFPPQKNNIYIFYFTDGDNWSDDDDHLIQVIKEKLGPNTVNLIGITQVLADSYSSSVRELIDVNLISKNLDPSYKQTVSIEHQVDHNAQILDAIKILLTPNKA